MVVLCWFTDLYWLFSILSIIHVPKWVFKKGVSDLDLGLLTSSEGVDKIEMAGSVSVTVYKFEISKNLRMARLWVN